MGRLLFTKKKRKEKAKQMGWWTWRSIDWRVNKRTASWSLAEHIELPRSRILVHSVVSSSEWFLQRYSIPSELVKSDRRDPRRSFVRTTLQPPLMTRALFGTLTSARNSKLWSLIMVSNKVSLQNQLQNPVLVTLKNLMRPFNRAIRGWLL